MLRTACRCEMLGTTLKILCAAQSGTAGCPLSSLPSLCLPSTPVAGNIPARGGAGVSSLHYHTYTAWPPGAATKGRRRSPLAWRGISAEIVGRTLLAAVHRPRRLTYGLGLTLQRPTDRHNTNSLSCCQHTSRAQPSNSPQSSQRASKRRKASKYDGRSGR